MRGSNYKVGGSMPYVRKEYIKGAPVPKITKFTMGNTKVRFAYKVQLIPLKKVQVRHNAIESARVAVNKVLLDKLGEEGYLLRMRIYPHVILRENKMMAFAGADRLQEGMRRSFGKPMGLAARVEPGRPVMEAEVEERGLDAAKAALQLGASKLPTTCAIEVIEAQ